MWGMTFIIVRFAKRVRNDNVSRLATEAGEDNLLSQSPPICQVKGGITQPWNHLQHCLYSLHALHPLTMLDLLV